MADPWKHLAVALSLLALQGGAPSESTSAAPEVLELAPYLRELVTVSAEVEGREVRLLFDTGGGMTVLAPDLVRSLGLESSGRSVGFRMSGERVEFPLCSDVRLTLGSRTIRLEAVGVWDVAGVLPEGLPRVDGVLALDAFESTPFTLDLRGKKLILETGSSLVKRLAHAEELVARLATGLAGAERTLFVRGSVGDLEDLWFLLDSGNIDRLAVSLPVAEAVALAEAGFEVPLQLEGLPAMERPTRAREILYDGVVSAHELAMWRVTMDVSGARVWVGGAE